MWRVYYANKSKDRSDIPSNIYAFLVSIKSYATMYNSRNVYIAWDKKVCHERNFRQLSTEGDYKGTRDQAEAQVVYESHPKIHEATELLGCKNFYPWVMEADDIIAWLSKTLDGQCIIVTTDQDMLQLVTDKTCVFHPRKKVTIDHTNFEESVGMPIEHFLPYKAILGDSSDNIKGIHGYGPVHSKTLAKQWIENKSEISNEHVAIIENNIKLMDLSSGYKIAGAKEVEYYQEQLEKHNDTSIDIKAFESLCKKYNYKSILKNMNKWRNAFEEPHLLKILNNLGL
jgi:5'-3' exonuclease